MNYGYIRVSSDKQTVENQRYEIIRFCASQNITVDGWIEETVSGMKNYDKREDAAKRDAKREIDRAMKARR
jgi:DNA invertase Pin-like site-specific DNA recombinase